MPDIFDFFPYTDEHTLNLDWILEVVENSKGLDRVELLSKVGRVATYRVYYSTGNYFDFQVLDGVNGENYVLTAQDRIEIANLVIEMLPIWNGGAY